MEKQKTAHTAITAARRKEIATVVEALTANNTVGAIMAAVSILSPIVDPDVKAEVAALRRLTIKKQEQADRIVKDALHITENISLWDIYEDAGREATV